MKKLVIKQKELPIETMSTMGCRTQNGADINALESFQKNIQAILHDEPLYDNFKSAAQKDSRGNICPVTVILPTIAMEAKEIWEQDVNNEESLEDVFLHFLDKKIHEAKDMLIERFEYICAQPAESAKFMYENGLMAGYDGKDIRSALKHGTLALGQLGLAECLQILIGKDHTTDEGMELAKKIEQLFKDRCAEFKQKYKLNFGVYYTPSNLLGVVQVIV